MEDSSRIYARHQLRQLPLLRLLDDAAFDQVIRLCRAVNYPKHAVILNKGMVNDWLGFILKGQIQVIDELSSGIEIGLNMINAGMFFGEISVIDRKPRSARLVAVAECEVLLLPGDLTRQLFFRYPPIAESMLQHFTSTLRRMNDLRALLSIPNSTQRLSALLVFLVKQDAGGLHVIEPMPTHHELAIMINASRETVTRSLSELKRLGVAEKDHSRLIIRSPEELKKLAIQNS